MKIKKYLTNLVFILFICINVFSQTDKETKSNKLFIWEVSSNTNKVYLLGSIHMATEEIYPLNEKIENAFNESDYLVVEANILNIDQAEIQNAILKYGIYSDESSLKSVLPEKVYTSLSNKAIELGLNEMAFEKMKPWLAAMTMSVVYLTKINYKAELGIDYYYLNKSKEQNKEILELESMDFQFKVLYDLPEETQILYLESTLDELSTMEEGISKIVEYWQNGDDKKMEEIVFSSFSDKRFHILVDKLFTERNKQMTAKIEDHLKNDKTYFIIVGAGHLVGKDGIINTLIKKGYKVSQIEK